MNVAAQIKKFIFLFILIIFSAFCFRPSTFAVATCLGESWCESCCDPNFFDHRDMTGSCCQQTPLNANTCNQNPCLEVGGTRGSCAEDANAGVCQISSNSGCTNGTVLHSDCSIGNPYYCNVCIGATCSLTKSLTPCNSTCDINNPNSCINACAGAINPATTDQTKCANGFSCLCAGCAGAPNCNQVPTCVGQCCNNWTCIAANTQESADCGGWYGCAFNTTSYVGANGTTCPTGGNVPAQCLGGAPTNYGCTKGDCTANAVGASYVGNATCNNNCNLNCKVEPIAALGSTNKSGSNTYYNPYYANAGKFCSQEKGLTTQNYQTIVDPAKVSLANNPAKFRVTCTTEENDQANVSHFLSITPTAQNGVTFKALNPTPLTPMPTLLDAGNNKTATLEQSIDFEVKFDDNVFDNATLNLVFSANDAVKDILATQTYKTNTANVTQVQQVDTKTPVLTRTNEFKLADNTCIGSLDCPNLDPNKILGSGKLQVDYKATDASGLLQRTIFAGSANWGQIDATKTNYFNELDQVGNSLGKNLVKSFDYLHKIGANYTPLQTDSILVDPTGFSNKDSVIVAQNLPIDVTADVLSVVYNLKTPEEPITKPFSFNWGLGGNGANDANSTWQATDNFCNRISGAQESNLQLGNSWASVVGGSTFVQGQIQSTIPQGIINAADPTGSKNLKATGFSSTYLTRSENDSNAISYDANTDSKYGLSLAANTIGDGESLLNSYKISHGRSVSLYDYYKNIIGTVNRYDENSEIYCTDTSQKYFRINNTVSLNNSVNLNDLNSLILSEDLQNLNNGCNAQAQVYDITGDLVLANNVQDIVYQKSTIVFVSGNLKIDASIVSANNSSLLFIVRGDVTILGGKYSSINLLTNAPLTPLDKPGYDQIDASFIVDGVFLSLPDDGDAHTYFGGNYPQVGLPAAALLWDGLEINGSLLLSGLCPNDMNAKIPTYDEAGVLTSVATRADTNNNCTSKLGRDLILVQNFLYPAEKITFNAQYLVDFRYLLRSMPKFKIVETGYDPTK